ncbi:MAG: hypothetical protein HoeaKO_04450 [Hoeflea alexandrii]
MAPDKAEPDYAIAVAQITGNLCLIAWKPVMSHRRRVSQKPQVSQHEKTTAQSALTARSFAGVTR